MSHNTNLPTAFDSIAATCKFIAVSRISPEFYDKYQHPVEFTCAFVRQFASIDPAIEKAFRNSLPLPISEGALKIEQGLQSSLISEKDMNWLDNQLTEVLKILLPVVRDQNLPDWLLECKWAVEGAFENI